MGEKLQYIFISLEARTGNQGQKGEDEVIIIEVKILEVLVIVEVEIMKNFVAQTIELTEVNHIVQGATLLIESKLGDRIDHHLMIVKVKVVKNPKN